MKILFIQHLHFLNGSGGTEKICSFLANGFAKQGHQVTIATNQDIIGKPVFEIDRNIEVVNIYNPRVIQKELKSLYNYKGRNPIIWLISKIKKKSAKIYNNVLRKDLGGDAGIYKFNLSKRAELWNAYINELSPDVIVTMSISSLLEVTYNNKINIPIVNSVNGRPDYDYRNIFGRRSDFEMRLLEESFKNLSGIQVLFKSYCNFLPSTFKGKQYVIPNPVPQTAESDVVNHLKPKGKYRIIHIGRLDDDCKQQSIAIKIFNEIASVFPEWELEFWGIGHDHNMLKQMISSYNLNNRVFLKGFTDNPLEKIKEGDIFIFPSKYEGFGLALGEAMSAGLPCLGFQSCSGVNELIEHGVAGFLAKDESEMQKYLEELMQNRELRKEMGFQAHLAMKRYSPHHVLDAWKNVISDIVRR
ncbi:glycosyltransferase [Sphingobacterium spiritivorum]|uniref:glycosyltransferase n=1 Tax=Sphingobacterium spiritivorum TaxID=258 RepID=UPI001918E1D7|nr:glycosyltransferase [Sphingobacterium spiritivorum]QQT27083.1 glycosyltransferase [Sphingobacterium spiritivorum]